MFPPVITNTLKSAPASVAFAAGGNVTGKFVDYSYEANRALVDASFAGTEFLKEVPEEAREAMARYPETTQPAE